MPYPIERKLVIAVSSSAVFDMAEANTVFETEGEEAYRQYQRKRLDEPFTQGVAFQFIKRLLGLNSVWKDEEPVQVVVLSRNDPDSGRRFFRSCANYKLDITRGVFLSGKSPHPYVPAFNASLFLSATQADVQAAIHAGLPAGLVIPTSAKDDDADKELRIAFDFDGVIADDEAETVYRKQDLEHFQDSERRKSTQPHNPGPLKDPDHKDFLLPKA